MKAPKNAQSGGTQIPPRAAAAILIGATILIVAAMCQNIKDEPRKEQERRAANKAHNAEVLKVLAARAQQDTESAKKGKVRVGMIDEQCRIAWGDPDHINRTTDAGGVHEQWVYDARHSYLYFDDEVLKSIQDSGLDREAAEPPKMPATPAASAPVKQVTAASTPNHQFATVTEPVEIAIPYGKTTLPRGTKLQVVSRTASTVTVVYLDQTVTIPISAIDLR